MLAGLFRREKVFFDLFSQSAKLMEESALELKNMLSNLAQAENYARRIKVIETKADEVTHKTVELLHTTFITPFDREDIHALITKMDDVIDFIESVSERIRLYKVIKSTEELHTLADICYLCAQAINKIIAQIHNLKKPDSILVQCVELNRLENEADYALRAAIARLFEEEKDAKEIIKLKDIYELLENATDSCEDVANIVEGIILEYA